MVSELEWLNVYLMADSFMQSVEHQSFMFVIPIRIGPMPMLASAKALYVEMSNTIKFPQNLN